MVILGLPACPSERNKTMPAVAAGIMSAEEVKN